MNDKNPNRSISDDDALRYLEESPTHYHKPRPTAELSANLIPTTQRKRATALVGSEIDKEEENEKLPTPTIDRLIVFSCIYVVAGFATVCVMPSIDPESPWKWVTNLVSFGMFFIFVIPVLFFIKGKMIENFGEKQIREQQDRSWKLIEQMLELLHETPDNPQAAAIIRGSVMDCQDGEELPSYVYLQLIQLAVIHPKSKMIRVLALDVGRKAGHLEQAILNDMLIKASPE